MSVVEGLQQELNRLGFDAGPVDGDAGPMTRTAVARFQLAYNLGPHLVVDGLYGPMTLGALFEVRRRGDRLSPSFTVAELRTRTSASGPKNGTCWVHRDLLVALERLRAHVGRPLPVISGWRDVAHNARVGGARTSQHTFGTAPELRTVRDRLSPGAELVAGRAADIPRRYITLADARSLRLFSGLGWLTDGGQSWVTHVDVRTSASPASPVEWRYG